MLDEAKKTETEPKVKVTEAEGGYHVAFEKKPHYDCGYLSFFPKTESKRRLHDEYEKPRLLAHVYTNWTKSLQREDMDRPPRNDDKVIILSMSMVDDMVKIEYGVKHKKVYEVRLATRVTVTETETIDVSKLKQVCKQRRMIWALFQFLFFHCVSVHGYVYIFRMPHHILRYLRLHATKYDEFAEAMEVLDKYYYVTDATMFQWPIVVFV